MTECLAPISCDVCRQTFIPRSDSARACGFECAMKLVRAGQKARAAEKRADRLKLLELKPRTKWLREAQQAFNLWIVRVRDKGKPCVSCGRHHKGKVDAGHYIASGDREALTFDPANVHAQCHPCNGPRHGALVQFRAGLLERIGPDEVARLEGCDDKKLHTIPELREIRDHYRRLVREVQRKES